MALIDGLYLKCRIRQGIIIISLQNLANSIIHSVGCTNVRPATACLFHLPLQAFVAAIMKLKARALSFLVIARNQMMGTSRTSDKSVIQNK